ncbi:hypothetical protein [Geotalea toluenoxydans]|uniref:hypothetical protein n=1 Tax=Geotalea toluenoxydans TaxID=421624 RepID=UPI001FB4C8D5|nr:hypothetical protein [Geotalea toluenoxydans]
MIGTESKIGEFFARARANILFLRLYEKEVFVHAGDAKEQGEYVKKWNEKKERLDLWFSELEKMPLSPQERGTLKRFKPRWSNMVTVSRRFWRLLAAAR